MKIVWQTAVALAFTGAACFGQVPTTRSEAPVDVQSLQAARKVADDVYGSRFRNAKTTAEKAALATEMIEAATQIKGGSPDQYVLLKIAADIAAGAGDATISLQAVEKIVEQFEVSGSKLMAEALVATARNATTAQQHAAICKVALNVVSAAADTDEYELALKLCEAAKGSAQITKQQSLAMELMAKAEDVKNRQSDFLRYRDACAVLEKEPTEPAANLTAGRYLCFVKGDWKEGIAMLALSKDAALKSVAVKDLGGANLPEEQVSIGDAWWDLAQTTKGQERDAMTRRAGLWYQQAEARLPEGLVRLKIRQRVKSANLSLPAALVTNRVGMKLVLIPAGDFLMGSSESAEELANAFTKYEMKPIAFLDEQPAHRVRITKPFYLGQHEVTISQFARFVVDTGYKTDAEKDGRGGRGYDSASGQFPDRPEFNWRNVGFPQTANHPVVNVTYNDAVEFCQWLSRKEGRDYRLPTEAEWEYSCRAGTTTRYSSGDSPETLATVGNVADATAKAKFPDLRTISAADGYVFPAPVGSFRPNEFGVYDMHGNALEWCADWYSSTYYAVSPAVDPTGPSSGEKRVCRGGTWSHGLPGCRSAERDKLPPGDRFDFSGFRVAMTP